MLKTTETAGVGEGHRNNFLKLFPLNTRYLRTSFSLSNLVPSSPTPHRKVKICKMFGLLSRSLQHLTQDPKQASFKVIPSLSLRFLLKIIFSSI